MLDALTPLGSEPAAYRALHDALDESVADALLDPREHELRETFRAVCAAEVAPRAAAADHAHTFVAESYAALADRGLAGLIVPQELGGTGDSHVAYAVAMEEITAACAATSLVYMTQMHAAFPIMLAGSDELQHRYVPGLVDGTLIGSLGITEPDAGSDVASLRTVAATDTEGYRITGSKTFITSGDRADAIVLFATTDRARGRGGITAFVVTGDSAGLTRGRPLVKMGMHGSTTAELFLDGVPVPTSHRLGGEGDGWEIVMRSVVKSRVSAAAQGVGCARAAYARTAHVLNSLHGNRWPAGAAYEMATLRGRLLAGRLLLWSVAREIDRRGEASTAHIGVMKQMCTDLGWSTAVAAVRLLGPYGDLRELGVERVLRDSKVTQIYDGTNEVQHLLIARDTASRMSGLLAEPPNAAEQHGKGEHQ